MKKIIICLIISLMLIFIIPQKPEAQYAPDLEGTVWRILFRESGYTEYGIINFTEDQIILYTGLEVIIVTGYFDDLSGCICSIAKNDLVRCFQIIIHGDELSGRFTKIDLNDSSSDQYSTISGIQLDLSKSDHFIEPYINPNSLSENPPIVETPEKKHRNLPDHGICFIGVI